MSSLNGSSGPMRFDTLELTRVPFFVKDKEYCVREASAALAADYRNQSMRAARFVDGKMAGIEGAANADLHLVSMSVDEVMGEGRYKQANPAEVKRWPNHVFKWVLKTVRELSQLDDEEDTEESLEKQIDALEARLEEKRASKGRAEGDDADEGESKNSPGATTGASA